MSGPAPTRRWIVAAGLAQAGCATGAGSGGDARARAVGPLIHRDDFRSGLTNWRVELERGGTVEAAGGFMDIDVPAGATVWFRPELVGAVLIEYVAVAIAEDGPNDRVSDLNAFWMATDARSPANLLDRPRSGAFTDYDRLRAYYVGQGGNANTTTRLRRYVGEPGNRPLLSEHDLASPDVLLRPNVRQTIRLVAAGRRIEYWRDGVRLFRLDDDRPYTRGWFGLRTTFSHLRIANLRIYQLIEHP